MELEYTCCILTKAVNEHDPFCFHLVIFFESLNALLEKGRGKKTITKM
jgi:hypothetical protein